MKSEEIKLGLNQLYKVAKLDGSGTIYCTVVRKLTGAKFKIMDLDGNERIVGNWMIQLVSFDTVVKQLMQYKPSFNAAKDQSLYKLANWIIFSKSTTTEQKEQALAKIHEAMGTPDNKRTVDEYRRAFVTSSTQLK